jgi:hypothetical protein
VGGTGTPGRPGAWAWLAAGGVLLLGGAWWLRGRGRAPLRPESRRYLALRRAYERAGWGGRGLGPLDWVASLHREDAPGAAPAEEAVRLYLDARFAPAPGAAGEREALERAAAQARRELRARPRRRRARGAPG